MGLSTFLHNFKGIFFFSLIIILLTFFNNNVSRISASSSIIINEIMYDPTGSDTGYEWIELYNPLASDIDLDGWKIQLAGNIFQTAITLTELTIPSHSYVTICESAVLSCSYYVTKLGIQNGGSESDGIQLLENKGNIVDTVIFDSPNSSNLTDESGIVVTNDHTATESGSGKSLGRKNFIDTNNSADDFYVFDVPTLGEENKLADELAPTGEYPLLILLTLLFILISYSDRLDTYRLNLLNYINAKSKNSKKGNK